MKTFLAVLAVLAAPALASADPVKLTPTQAAQLETALNTVCPLLEQEAFEIQIIAEEKANPSGVVDLRRLHEAGQVLAETREQLRTARKENADGLKITTRVLHDKPLTVAFCTSWDQRQERNADTDGGGQ
jgi:hypothetical protein